MSNAKRLYTLDLLKIIATICILGFHYQGHMQYVNEKGINFAFGPQLYGNVVELFFIISGFFLANSIARIKSGELSFFNFFKKKYLRFVPVCTVAAFAYYVIQKLRCSLLDLYLQDFSFWKTLQAALLINEGGAFPRSKINSPTWYISVLVICFVLFYFLTWLSTRLAVDETYLYIIMVMVGTSIYRMTEYENDFPFVNFMASRGYACVFLGIVIRQVIYDNKFQLKRLHDFLINKLTGALTLGVIVVAVLYKELSVDVLADWWYIFVFILFPACVLLMVNKCVSNSFVGRLSIWGVLGEISFDVFVWHMCVIFIWDILEFKGLMPFDMHSKLGFWIFVACMWILGAISHYCIYKPADKLLHRFSIL